jgi:hypothetical protein
VDIPLEEVRGALTCTSAAAVESKLAETLATNAMILALGVGIAERLGVLDLVGDADG